MKKYSDEENLKRFNKDTENAWKNYHKNKSEEAKKEKQKKLDDWRKAMGDSTWWPKPVKLEIVQVEESRWKGLFKGLGFNKKTIKNFWFRIKLAKQQKIQRYQLITIKGEDTNGNVREYIAKINNREHFTRLFAKKERLYVYKDIITGEIKIKRAKNLRDLYGKVGGLYRIESLGWLPIDMTEEMKKTIKELSYE